MKIAMMTNNYKPFVGGVPISIERQAAELRKLGHRVIVFAPDYSEDGRAEVRDKSPEEIRREMEAERDVVRFQVTKRSMENGMVYPKLINKEIIEKFEEERFDCIHVHQPMFVGTTALWLGRKYRIPVFYTYHTRYEDYLHYISFFKETQETGRWKKQLIRLAKELVVPSYMRWFTNRCDFVFAPSAGMLERIRRGGTCVPMAVLPTGLDEKFFLEDRKRTAGIRSRFVKQGEHLFCTVSRMEEEKNPVFLLKGIQRLREKFEERNAGDFKVLFIGDGSMRGELERMAEEMGLGDTIVFLGNIPNDEVGHYLRASELFLFASKSETQGIVLEEAMAAGNPVTAVRASGVEDIVEDGVNGCMTAEDIEEWSERAAKLVLDGHYEEKKMQAERTASGYRASRLALYAEAIYEECISRKGREDMDYERESDGKGNTAVSVHSIFRAS